MYFELVMKVYITIENHFYYLLHEKKYNLTVTHPYKLYCNIFNAYDMQYDYAIGLYIYLFIIQINF